MNKSLIVKWCGYDFGSNAFPTLIITFIFSTYFTKGVVGNAIEGTVLWSYGLTVAGLTIAILAPVIGDLCHNHSLRRRIFFLFNAFTIILTALLFFTKPHFGWVYYGLIVAMAANLFYELALIIYNGLLRDIVEESWFGRISGWGWGSGYLGGLLSLVLSLFIIKSGIISTHQSLNVRSCVLLAAGWFLLFCLPLLLSFPRSPKIASSKPPGKLFTNLKQTVHGIIQQKELAWFFVARLFFMDGLNTLFAFGGIYAANTFHFSYSEVLIFAIAINLTAGLGSASFAWLDDRIGAANIILSSLIGLVICSAVLIITQHVLLFWVFAITLGIFVGPVQASGRSYLLRMAPPEQNYEMFGFYSLVGRITAFIGPFFVGSLTLLFHSQRAGMSVILFLLLLGLGCFTLSWRHLKTKQLNHN